MIGAPARTRFSKSIRLPYLDSLVRLQSDTLGSRLGTGPYAKWCGRQDDPLPDHVSSDISSANRGVTSIRCVSRLLHHEVHGDHEGLLPHALRLRSQRHYSLRGSTCGGHQLVSTSSGDRAR